MKKEHLKKIELEIRKSKNADYKYLLNKLRVLIPNANIRLLRHMIHQIRVNYKDKSETLVHNGKYFLFAKKGSNVHRAWIKRMTASINTQKEIINYCK